MSHWFKRRMMSLGILGGVIVVVAVSVSFGAVGIGVGIAVLAGVVALVRLERRRRWAQRGSGPDGTGPFPD